MKQITISNVNVTVKVEQSDIPVIGNVVGSGDDQYDKQMELQVLSELENGNVWAWCDVTVVVSLKGIENANFSTFASLSGCCYENEANFKEDGYFELVNQCLQQLNDAMKVLWNDFAEDDPLLEIDVNSPVNGFVDQSIIDEQQEAIRNSIESAREARINGGYDD